ncbi:MAG: transcription repressor NadR [Chloroflexi bacterium]|nr:transcription repressor NadR [Chloroflexota bacterium]
MTTEERRQAIKELLATARRPVPGRDLARIFDVSRQVVVQDIAVLRAAGVPIVATSRGYTTPPVPGLHRSVVAVRHRPEQTAEELFLIVDQGVRVVDVIVEHPIYGELRGLLMHASREDVRAFLDLVRSRRAHLLSELTDGVHLHTLEADDPWRLARVRQLLAARGFLLDGDEPGQGADKAGAASSPVARATS